MHPRGSGPPGSSWVRGFQIDVIEGPDAGMHWEATRDRCRIGIHPSCDLQLGERTVSRFHCEIVMDAQGARVRDLGSVNGTFLDGIRVIEAYLKNGTVLRLGRAVVRFQYMGKNNTLRLSERTEFGKLVGASPRMRALFAILEQAAPTNSTILLEGETGTGKSAAAWSIHAASDRKHGPFIMVDCGAIPGNLLESELFGHEKGAFTGATGRRVGAFEEASGGTVFLDEIGELPYELQAKLLKVLEKEQYVRRLGSNEQRRVDVRVIAATNRDLRAEVNAGRFREDLYFRLAVVTVEMPPLRQRLDDVPLLAERLLAELNAPPERIQAILTPRLVHELEHAAWPGNIRELTNYLERYLIFGDAELPAMDWAGDSGLHGDASLSHAAERQRALDEFERNHMSELRDELERKHLPELRRAPRPGTDWPAENVLSVDASLPYATERRRVLDEFEREYLLELLRLHDGKVAQAAAAAGLERTYLYRLLRRHDIVRPRKDDEP